VDKFSKRKYIIIGFFLAIGAIFGVRLFYLQVINKTYKQFATNNVLRRVVTYPARGLMYDRNMALLVYNKAAYDLQAIPREIKPFDTLALCNIVQIDRAELREALRKAKAYSRFKPSPIVRQIPPEVYAPLQEKLYKFPGFYVQARTVRDYPQKIAAQVLGYVGEVTQSNIDKDSYYKSGDYIGVSGLEKAYEKDLRGIKGINYYMVDVHNRIKGKYNNSQIDTAAVLGRNIITTLDAKLQAYAELLMQNKKGAVVAIEPQTGEVLTMVSVPTYDPNMLVGRRGKEFAALMADTLKPLYNRAITAAYPPGSTFKPINALIALQEGTINEYTSFSCSGTASTPIRCTHYHETPVSLRTGIRESCNPYFWNTFRSIIQKYPKAEQGFEVWRHHVMSFGLGQKISPEFTSGESAGNVPETSYFNRFFGKGRWNALTVRSLAIGQGELLVTPFQLANYVSAIANRGYYIEPHLVRAVQNDSMQFVEKHYQKKYTSIKSEYYNAIIDGMQAVVEETGNRATAFLDSITICGKTGTVQNPHGADHSVFIAFAPKYNPKIAIAVYIENGVWGARYAAPIASLLIEKYLTDSISPRRQPLEQRMIDANLLNPLQPK
jgi:penicillin-binding protein 2